MTTQRQTTTILRTLSLMLVVTLCAFSASTASAARVKYIFKVETGDAHWDGTWSYPHIHMTGDKGQTDGYVKIDDDGHQTGGGTANYEVMLEDIGTVNYIWIYLAHGPITDVSSDWVCKRVTIQSPHEPGSDQFTTTIFNVGETFKAGGEAQGFAATRTTGRPIVESFVRTTGQRHSHIVPVTQVNFHFNNSGDSQPVNKMQEHWSSESTIAFSTTRETNKETVLGVEFSVDAPFVSLGGSASHAWGESFAETEENSRTNISGSSIEWDFTAPSYAWIFRKITYNVPEEYVQYQESSTGQSCWVRKVGGRITQVGYTQFLQVPTKFKMQQGEAPAVAWSEIENRFLQHMDNNNPDKIAVLNLKQQWLRDGVVYEGNSPSEPPQTQPQSQPQGNSNAMAVRLVCVGNDRRLRVDHENLVSTKSDANDIRAQFEVEGSGDGETYRIKSKATGRYLRVDGGQGGDQLLSTRSNETDSYTKFFMERQNDGSYRIKVKATGRYLHLNGYHRDQLASTLYQEEASDPFTRFRLIAP